MRTLSGKFTFVVLAVIVIVAVVSCCYFPLIPDTKTYVEIGSELRGKRTYVEWKGDGTKFKQALEQVRGHKGEYCICVLETPRDEPTPYPYSKCPEQYTCPRPPENNPPGNIRTVKVTKSKAADNIAAGESAVNDPHVTYRVQSPDPGDIIKVLGALE
jgi:hypothetical protein